MDKQNLMVLTQKASENPMLFMLENLYYLISKISSPAVIAPALRWLNSE